jgi:hypothetical protein
MPSHIKVNNVDTAIRKIPAPRRGAARKASSTATMSIRNRPINNPIGGKPDRGHVEQERDVEW